MKKRIKCEIDDNMTLCGVLNLGIPLHVMFRVIVEYLEHSGKHEVLQNLALDMAEAVLPIYEEAYPADNRPRRALEVRRAHLAGEMDDEEMAISYGDVINARLFAVAHRNYAVSNAVCSASYAADDTYIAFALNSAAYACELSHLNYRNKLIKIAKLYFCEEMKITPELIMRWDDPCRGYDEDRIRNLVGDGMTPLEIMDLEIPLVDRTWMIVRNLEHLGKHEELSHLALDMAEAVLPIYEKEFPDDDRLRRAIEARRAYFADAISYEEFKTATHADAYAAASYAAAAYVVSFAAARAAYACYGAVAADAARAAASAADAADDEYSELGRDYYSKKLINIVKSYSDE